MLPARVLQGDFLQIAPSFSGGAFDLVIADPPYWKAIDAPWDYEWRTRDDYFTWCECWVKELKRIVRFGGAVFVFGYFRMLARISLLLEQQGFLTRQEIIVDKGLQAVAGRATRKYQLWPNTSESILFVVKNSRPFVAAMLRDRQKSLGLTAKAINQALGVKTNGGGMWSIFTAENVCGQLPTRAAWEKLQDVLEFDLPYERIAPTFHVQLGWSSIWTDIDFRLPSRVSPAQKPEPLIERLVLACSNPQDHVLDLFAGSGTTSVVCSKLDRHAVAVEKDKRLCAKIRERLVA